MIRHATPLVFVLLAACAATPESPRTDGGSLTILHINDHHSHLAGQSFAFDVAGLELESGAQSVTVEYGGMPRLTTLFAERGRAHENVLKLHAGDAITGTLYYTGFEGEADAAMMGGICFDAFAIGNHEFDHGDQGLAGFLAALDAWRIYTEPAGGFLAARERMNTRRRVIATGGTLAIVNLFLIGIWIASGSDYFWPAWVMLGSVVALALKAIPWSHAWHDRMHGTPPPVA
jgi:hypothetical protein